MRNNTWVCISCRQKYRRAQQSNKTVLCSRCGKPCEYVHWKIRVPSPRKDKAWQAFWRTYLQEKQLLQQFYNGTLEQDVHLELLNITLSRNLSSHKK
ncbi:hypothetical protein [Celerinatantimonas sp. MCCC 1A17872]|uniref:hypothetical protein n=1 Tax=Celerinatantimonas sp. MCCC 1A17872 TaxID=3177514 RepID=UPI0038BE9BF0